MNDEFNQDEEDWCARMRERAIAYLKSQAGLVFGEVGEWPAWHVAPYASVWAVESVAHPGSVGWWVIAGDLPTDYCSAGGARHPKLAIRRIAARWLDAVRATGTNDMEIGETGLPVSLLPLLQARADMLLEFTEDEQLWQG